jgi:hypothetical protein
MIRLLQFASPMLWYAALTGGVIYGLHVVRSEGYEDGFALAQAKGKTEIAAVRQEWNQEKLKTALAATAAADNIVQSLIEQQSRTADLALQLTDTKAQQRRTTERLTKEIAHVTTLYRRALDAQLRPLPAAVFTHGFVRVWNTANGISATMPGTQSTATAAPPSDRTRVPDDLASDVTQSQLLNNHIRNGELHAACRAQLNALIDWTLNETK